MDDDIPDGLLPVPISTIIDEWIVTGSEEVARKLGWKGRSIYPSFPVLKIILTTLAVDFPSLLKQYNEKEKLIDAEFGNAISRKFNMYSNEAEERHKNLLTLWNQMGPGKIDTKRAPSRKKDDIDFSGWEDQ
jgi:hypothetical protein